MKTIFKILFAATILFAIYYAFIYFIPFSEGYRAGELTKISKKGVVFKTWEGGISQGVSESQLFEFSVQKNQEAVIALLKDMQGQQVKLTYIERYATFPWLGETKYYVTKVEDTKKTFD